MSLPRKVQEQADAAEAALKAITEPPEVPAPNEGDQAATETQPNPEVVEKVASEPVEQQQEITVDPDAKWEERYKVLQGKYNAEIPRLQEELKKLREQVGSPSQESQLRAEIDQLKNQLAQPAAQPAYEPPSNAMIDKIRDDYGSDLADVFAAMQSENTRLSQQLSDLANQTTQMRTTSTDQAFRAMLDAQGIDFDQANNDPLFNDWLDEIDQFSGISRKELLNNAYRNGDLRRSAQFFTAYYSQVTPEIKNESKPKPSLEDQVRVQSQATSSDNVAPEQPVWTQQQITEYYDKLRRGMYTQEEAQRLENQLFAALRG